MSTNQYELTVENGSIVAETGFFFRAAPFTIHAANQQIDCTFIRDGHDVVYRLSSNNSPIADLAHPDYAIDNVSPTQLDDQLNTPFAASILFVALVQLGITIDTEYKEQLGLEEQTYTFKVIQAQFEQNEA